MGCTAFGSERSSVALACVGPCALLCSLYVQVYYQSRVTFSRGFSHKQHHVGLGFSCWEQLLLLLVIYIDLLVIAISTYGEVWSMGMKNKTKWAAIAHL